MPRSAGLLAVTVFALAAAGCATTMTVSSHVERGLDFSHYRTYDWGPADALPVGDPRLEENPFFQDHFLGAVEKELAARGLEQVTSGTPDLLIHYHACIDPRLSMDRTGTCHPDECPSGVVAFELGTLVLDIVDARTNRLVWRGWAQDSVEGVLGNPDTMERKIKEAARRMLERLPAAL